MCHLKYSFICDEGHVADYCTIILSTATVTIKLPYFNRYQIKIHNLIPF